MKGINLILILFILTGCTQSAQNTNTTLTQEIKNLKLENEELKKTIELLRYPASDRLQEIKKLIGENQLSIAENKIIELKELFPISPEAKQCVEQEKVIAIKKEKIKAEEDRIKALGFKSLKEETIVTIDYNKIQVGKFSIAQTFTFDAYDDRYFYKTADRGNKYVSARITITSKDKDPKLPVFYAYSVSGDKLNFEGDFMLRFARWEDYATYLGNYNDNSNDFSKTASIPFKIGLEINSDIAQQPLLILLKLKNCMQRENDRFANPPVYYVEGSDCSYASSLSLEDVRREYCLVKFLNKEKMK